MAERDLPCAKADRRLSWPKGVYVGRMQAGSGEAHSRLAWPPGRQKSRVKVARLVLVSPLVDAGLGIVRGLARIGKGKSAQNPGGTRQPESRRAASRSEQQRHRRMGVDVVPPSRGPRGRSKIRCRVCAASRNPASWPPAAPEGVRHSDPPRRSPGRPRTCYFCASTPGEGGREQRLRPAREQAPGRRAGGCSPSVLTSGAGGGLLGVASTSTPGCRAARRTAGIQGAWAGAS